VNTSFHDLESVMTTRLALIRSVRRKEERQQIGKMETPFMESLTEVEKRCLIRLSEAARHDGQIQIALNAIVRAQRLEHTPSFNVSQEFANVLWLQKEEKPATEYLQALLKHHADVIEPGHKASLLAQLVSSGWFY
jgi:ataxia telangiectasia mutated family protein